MHNLKVHKSAHLFGTLIVPPSKSHSQRAILFSMLAKGKSSIYNILPSPDCEAMIQAISLFGAKVEKYENSLLVEGSFGPASDRIDAQNSGQIFRFIGAISALLPSWTMITGDASIQTNRPIQPLLSALKQLGAMTETIQSNSSIRIQGPIYPGKCILDGKDSQPVSGLLMATSFLRGSSEIFVENPGETPWIDMTLAWLSSLGADIKHRQYVHFHVKGMLNYDGFIYTVPGDFSTAAFPIVAAIISHSTLVLEGLDPNDIQGDKEIITILQKMGAMIQWKSKKLVIRPSQLKGLKIDINRCIDALPILAVIGCFAEGTTHIYNGEIARKKESNRISCICNELRKMGAMIEERLDGLFIHQSSLKGNQVESHQDHRIALSLAIAALGAEGYTIIRGVECIQKTYPNFVKDFQKLGANIELDLIRV